jgi:hypothetical protein
MENTVTQREMLACMAGARRAMDGAARPWDRAEVEFRGPPPTWPPWRFPAVVFGLRGPAPMCRAPGVIDSSACGGMSHYLFCSGILCYQFWFHDIIKDDSSKGLFVLGSNYTELRVLVSQSKLKQKSYSLLYSVILLYQGHIFELFFKPFLVG